MIKKVVNSNSSLYPVYQIGSFYWDLSKICFISSLSLLKLVIIDATKQNFKCMGNIWSG